MKIGDQALYLAQLKGLSKSEAMNRIKEWFLKFEMQTWWNKKVEDLSKGMSQKLQFVTTVLHEPKLIILDEPFSGLDPVNTNLIKDEIYNLAKRGATVIFSTEYRRLARAINFYRQSPMPLSAIDRTWP